MDKVAKVGDKKTENEINLPNSLKRVKLGEIGEIIYGERLDEKFYDFYGDSFIFGTGGEIGKTKLYLNIGTAIVIPRKGSINNPKSRLRNKERAPTWCRIRV